VTDGASSPTDGGGNVGPETPSGLPCPVAAVLAQHCTTCHGSTPLNGAPDSLMTWDDTQKDSFTEPGKKIYQVMQERIHDDANPMPPAPNARLSANDTATIDGWVNAGAAKSTDDCSAQGGDAGYVDPLNCTPDLHVRSTSPWTMPQDQANQYVCYGMLAPTTGLSGPHVIAFAPHIDNPKIVHHILVFEQGDKNVEPTDYPTTPQPCASGGNVNWRIIYGWAPGGKNLYLPQEAGFPTAGSRYVVQVHYNNIAALSGQTDSSGIDMCTGPARPNEADVLAFGTETISIPPNGTLDRTCSLTLPSQIPSVTIFTAMPHMHQLGTQISTTLTQADGGAQIDLGTVNNWNFQTQYWLPLQTTTTNTGDTITTHCAWKNPTMNTVKFGENTEDEMCFSFTMYYPRIQTALWSWQIPAATSQCK
jgi:hypothetical protein